LGIAVALIAPLTAISYLSVNLSQSEIEQRLNGLDILSPKSEESQIVYHTAYEEETDRLRRKYYFLGTLSFFMIYAKYKLGNPLSAIIHYLRNAPPH
jgi:hypothetical protein